MQKVKPRSYRRKDRFLVVGQMYEVVSHPEQGTYHDLPHRPYLHYFPKGTWVFCEEVSEGYGDFKGVLVGEFYSPQFDMAQSMTVMDVKRLTE